MKSLSAAGEQVEEEEEEEEEAAERHEDEGDENGATGMIVDAEAVCHDIATSERPEAAPLEGKNSNKRKKSHKKQENVTQREMSLILFN